MTIIAILSISSAFADNYKLTKLTQTCEVISTTDETTERDREVTERCSGLGGYDLLIKTKNGKKSIKLVKGNFESTELNGYNSDADFGSSVLTWVFNDKGSLKALIFKLATLSPISLEVDHDEMQIVRIDGEDTCVVEVTVPDEFQSSSRELAKNISKDDFCYF